MYQGWRSLALFMAVALLASSLGCTAKQDAAPASAVATPAASIQGSKPAEQTGPALPPIPTPGAEKAQLKSSPLPADTPFPVVAVETSAGNFTLTLDATKADRTVANFLDHAKRGDYNGTIFHQVIKGYVILGGSYGTDLAEKPSGSETVFNQAHNGLKNVRGTIALARQPENAHSGKTMFFINLADNPQLDHKDTSSPENWGYCVFGKVTEGMEIIDAIAGVPVKDAGDFESTPATPVVIKSIRRVR